MNNKQSILIRNIYYMLSYAYKALKEDSVKTTDLESFENIKDLFSGVLVTAVSNQILKGLSKDYIAVNENVAGLRGKIDIRGSMRHQFRKRKELSCTFDLYSENYIMNQIIKTALDILITSKEVKSDIKDKIKYIYMYFNNVEKIDPRKINWSKIKFRRNNSNYKMIMDLCRYVIDEMIISSDKNQSKLSSFKRSQALARLFEKFILEFYLRHYRKFYPKAETIKWDVDGYDNFLPKMRSDISLRKGKYKLIIDAKFYSKIFQRYYDVKKVNSSNLYQIFAYVKNEDNMNTGDISGMLLYAKTDEEIMPDCKYNISGSKIYVKTLDLNSHFENIKEQLSNIIKTWIAELSN